MTDYNKNKSGMIVLLIFLLICSGLGISAFVMSFTKKCGEGFTSTSVSPPGPINSCIQSKSCMDKCDPTERWKYCKPPEETICNRWATRSDCEAPSGLGQCCEWGDAAALEGCEEGCKAYCNEQGLGEVDLGGCLRTCIVVGEDCTEAAATTACTDIIADEPQLADGCLTACDYYR